MFKRLTILLVTLAAIVGFNIGPAVASPYDARYQTKGGIGNGIGLASWVGETNRIHFYQLDVQTASGCFKLSPNVHYYGIRVRTYTPVKHIKVDGTGLKPAYHCNFSKYYIGVLGAKGGKTYVVVDLIANTRTGPNVWFQYRFYVYPHIRTG